jgi:tetratricopeptide (TPR) repeat protein
MKTTATDESEFGFLDEVGLENLAKMGFKDMSEYPLFMNEIDLDNDENEDIKALNEIISHEETPEELKGEWKDQGNYYFGIAQKQAKEKKPVKIWYLKALKCYTNGIDEHGKSDDKILMATLYSNRAAVNLVLGNYGRVIEDCALGIGLDPTNVKLYFRSAKASMSMYKYANALKFCESGLVIHPNSKELLAEKNNALSKIQFIEKKKNQATLEQNQIKALKNEITSLKITFGDYLFANIKHFMQDSKIHRDKEGVKWPTIFIYEEYKQIDFIKAFCEETTFGDHLQVMFPPGEFCEWDLDHNYSLDKMEVYAILNQVPPLDKKKDYGKPRKVRLKSTTQLKTILQHPEYVVPGIPVFYIISTVGSFKEEFLKKAIESLKQGY